MPDTLGQMHTLSQLEHIVFDVLPEAERLLTAAKGELNVLAAEKRHAMVRRIISNLYISCDKLGMTDDAFLIISGENSPTLDAYRKRKLIEGLNKR